MESMNIAFFTDSYLPAMDGVVTSTLTFRKELERRGHNVYIFASSERRSKKKYRNKKTFLYSGIEFRPYPQYNVALFPYSSIFKMKDLDIDVIHAQTPFVMGFAAMMNARMFRYPLAGSFHTLLNNKQIVQHYYPKNKNLTRITKGALLSYLKFFYRRCNSVITPTSTIERMLNGYGIKNTTVVSNGIDTEIFNPRVSGDRVRNELRIRDSEKMLLYMGRLSREKRVEVMLKAAKVLIDKGDSIRFVIGGTGPAEHYYKDMANKLGLGKHVKFLGFVDQKELPSVYAASDALCMPSTFETQGIVCLEAMAIGKPVIGADYMAMRELIKNGKNGEKFRPGDYTQCARKIEKVLNNTKYYRNSTIESSKEFSAAKVADKLIDVYNLLLSGKAIY
ncbi:MAG: glycosyltransferase [Candidatus Micrarchaeota archaeon]|nr:glycosyltransferase [Candidatus Micrarchaeota archaeon]MDE1823775.1 glycosyltransferase [Candidatus Micrarchaeota archaeon]MDE1849572.1 glycosyltransferase [Candidatus Micrarchaeota archaeon]